MPPPDPPTMPPPTGQLPGAPNLQKAVETTIPALSGVLLAFMGALFAAGAITDAKVVIEPFAISIPFVPSTQIQMFCPRRSWIMGASALAGLCFYLSIYYCIRSQMAFFVRGRPEDFPDVPPPRNEDEQRNLNDMSADWNLERRSCARLGLNWYNMGLCFILLPLVFLLPSKVLLVFFLGWLIPLVCAIKGWLKP